MSDAITVRLPCPDGQYEPHLRGTVPAYYDGGCAEFVEVVARRLWWCEEHDQKCWPDGCHQFGLEEDCRMVEVFVGRLP